MSTLSKVHRIHHLKLVQPLLIITIRASSSILFLRVEFHYLFKVQLTLSLVLIYHSSPKW